jgi:hypothetical protein
MPRERSATLYRIPNVEQDLEIELFAPVREVEGGLLGLVARRLRAGERLAIHLVEVGENAIASAGHTSRLEKVRGQSRRRIIRFQPAGRRIRGRLREEPPGCVEHEAPIGIVH